MSEPQVSVWIITYNHAAYIADAIEGALMQRTNFPVEIVIGEDASKDNTRAIIEDYCTRYPGRIRLLPAEGNMGITRNTVRTLRACRGKYVAMCEGDDYWTDERKLQEQFDFMEDHPECSLTFHGVVHKFPDATMDFTQQNFKEDTWTGLQDVVMKGGSFIPTSSMFFRREYIDGLPTWLTDAKVVSDYPLAIYLAMQGRVRFLRDVMGVYRRAAAGSWSLGWNWWLHRSLTLENHRMFVAINRETRGRHFRLIASIFTKMYWELSRALLFSILRPPYRYFTKVRRQLAGAGQ